MNDSSLYLLVTSLAYILVAGVWLIYFMISRKYDSNKNNLVLVSCIALGMVFFSWLITYASVASYGKREAMDTEIWGGVVTKKDRDEVHCRHSYDCNCRMVPEQYSDTKGRIKTRLRRKCDTCYEHPYDVDWDIYTSLGNHTIDRIDRQGLQEPPRWTVVKVGEPVADTRTYYNWLKATKYSLLKKDKTVIGRQWRIPAYPDQIYDIWKIDRLVNLGVKIPDAALWNSDLMVVNSKVGPAKQANVVVVLTPEKDSAFGQGLYDGWRGAAKNDVVIVIGSTQPPIIDWVEVFAMTKSSAFQLKMKEDIQNLTILDRPTFMKVVTARIMSTYQRERMRNYEYLENEITPPVSLFAWEGGIFCLLMSIGLYFIFQAHKK